MTSNAEWCRPQTSSGLADMEATVVYDFNEGSQPRTAEIRGVLTLTPGSFDTMTITQAGSGQ